ncbi:MAG: histidine kinase N-terminal 7TM domain-containing protein, partial [Terriglobia bacterium]
MSASHVVGIIAAVANVIIGLALYTKNPRKATNRTFALIALGIGGWIVGVVLLEITVELFWFSFLSFFATLMGTGFLIFSRVFPSVEKKVARSFYVAAITPAALMGLLVFARRDLFVRGVLSQNQNRSLELELGPVFPVLVGYAIAMTAYAALALARKYARARGIEKLQLKYLFFGFSLFFVTVVSGNLVLPQLGVNHFVTFGPAMSLFFAGSTAYAIVKHRLLDLRLIILKSLGYSLTLFLAILAYAAGTLAIASAYPGVNPSTSSLVALVAAVFIVTPLRKLFARLTTALFARATYDPQDFTRQLARVISTEISLDALASSTVRLVKGSMRLSRVAFAVMENGNARVIVDEGFQAAGHAVLQRTAKSLEGESAMLVPSE